MCNNDNTHPVCRTTNAAVPPALVCSAAHRRALVHRRHFLVALVRPTVAIQSAIDATVELARWMDAYNKFTG
jgi:hypothetical protein